jgi:hypothetical protein
MILLDTHVHLYQPGELQGLLDAVHRHFHRWTAAAGRRPSESHWGLCLLEARTPGILAELARQVRRLPGPDAAGPWRLEATGEDLRLKARHHSGAGITLFLGRQMVTRERLEVLSLGALPEMPAPQTLEATLAATVAAGGIAVIPWSPGKWLGPRGQAVARLVRETRQAPPFCLGDICSRPRLPGWPSPFREARRRGIRVLAGSDPLPLPGGWAKAGRYATRIDTPWQGDLTLAQLKQLLAPEGPNLQPVGTRLGLAAFLREQAAWQRHRRKPQR